MSIVGNRVSVRLTALGRSQDWLGTQVGMRQQSVGAIVNGGVERPRKLREIAQALETSQEYLLGETDDPTPGLSESHTFFDYHLLSPGHQKAVQDLIARLREIESDSKHQS